MILTAENVPELCRAKLQSEACRWKRRWLRLMQKRFQIALRLPIGGDLTFTFPEIGEGGPPAAVVEVDTEAVLYYVMSYD